MKILGISGSSRPPHASGVYRLVDTVLKASGHEYELVSLRGKNIGGCTSCLGCVEDHVCKLRDDLEPLRSKIAEADAYVIGAPNFYNGINALTHALLERLYQFRHRTADTLWGKIAVAVGVGGLSGQICCDDIERFLAHSFIETIAKVSGQGAAACYTCGYGESCQVGVPALLYGPGVKIAEDMIPDITKPPEAMLAAEEAGKLLGGRLSSGFDRKAVTLKMQKIMMARFVSSS